jgi:plastocyanin
VVAVPLVLALGACGGDDPVVLEGRTLRLRLDEYRIIPQDVEVRPGRLRIVGTNVGRLTHNVKVARRNPDNLEAPAEEIDGTRSMQPGESAAVEFEDLRPGEYRLLCSIANHDDLGQYGTLIVRER